MSVGEIESAVTKLSAEELRAFSEWFDECRADAWDQQFEADVQAGKLDNVGEKATTSLTPVFASRFESFHHSRFLVSLPQVPN